MPTRNPLGTALFELWEAAGDVSGQYRTPKLNKAMVKAYRVLKVLAPEELEEFYAREVK